MKTNYLLGQVGKVTRGLMIGKRLLLSSVVSFCIRDDVGEGFCAFNAVLLEILCEDRKGEAFNMTGDAAETKNNKTELIIILKCIKFSAG